MKAVRVHQFGGIDALRYEEVPRPSPGPGEVLVRVAAAGVGPWDAWVREGKSAVPQPLPLIPGSDLAGVVEEVGPGANGLAPGDAVFGVTNARFTGAYAEFAVANAAMLARKPAALTDTEAAALPVVASTAWQMVFDHARVAPGQRVLVLGGAGNVGACAVQLARRAGAYVVATARAKQIDDVHSLGAAEVIDADASLFDGGGRNFDSILDTVGGDAVGRLFSVLRPGGVLVSIVAEPDQAEAAKHGVRALFFLLAVTSAGLDHLAELTETRKLVIRIGEVLPLSQVRLAHEMLAARPHKPGKIVLVPDA